MAMQLPDLVVSTRDIAIRLLGGTPPDKSPRSLGGSGTALTPTEPAGTPPRAAVMPVLYNAGARPRANTGVTLTPFDQLRSFADFDLVAIAKKDVKDQILGMEWNIQVRPEFKGQEKRLAKTIDAVRAFVAMPDALAGIEWSDWCGAVADEIMITDALTILPRRNLAGELIGLEQIDGATIVPLVDDRGRPALPPNPAYQQIVRGMPETEFLFGDLLYLPRNRRANSPYGKSNTEHVLVTANLAIRQALHELAFYTDGNVPDGGIWSVKGATADQLIAYQNVLDDIQAGRSDMRSGYMKVMPEGEYFSPKDRQWSYEFLEWLARVISWGFGVSPIPIAKQMNRSTGGTMESSAMEAGPRPIAKFIAGVVNRCLRVYGGVTEVEFAWADDEAEDATVVYQRQIALLARGALTLNRVREQQGEEAYDFETPPMIDTPSGPQLLEKLIEDLKNPPEPPPELAPKPPNGTGQDAGNAPADNPSPKASADDEEPTAQEKAWAAAFTKYRAAVAVDLKKWKGVVVKRAKAGRAQKAFHSAVIPFRLRKEIAEQVFSPGTIQLAINLFKGELKPTKARSKVEKAIVAVVDGWLKSIEPGVVAWALEQLPADKLAKKQDPPSFNAGDLADDLAKQLEAGGAVGVTEAAAAIGVNLDRVPENVVTYARRRAGELVGKTYVGGNWVDSTSGSAISDTLRKLVQDAVSLSIEESWTPAELASTLKGYFEISRAKTIARTETAYAYGNGAAELYKSEGVELLDVKDGPGCLPFGHDDAAPAPDDEPGTVQADAEAEGQIWTVGQYQGSVIGHPNCLPGGQVVLAPNATAVFARAYDGEMIVIHTAANDEIACTPNHPVLTTRGWLAAGLLAEGDDVFRCSDGPAIGRALDPQNDHVPATIEQVAGAFLESSGVESATMPASPEYFHGDGAGSDIHVVVADGLRPDANQPARFEHGLKLDFDRGSIGLAPLNSESAAALLCDRLLAPPDSGVRGLSASTSLLGRSLGSGERLGLAGSSQLPSTSLESGPEIRPVESMPSRDGVGVVASDVLPIEGVEVATSVLTLSHAPSRGDAPHLDSGLAQANPDGPLAHAESDAHLPATLAALIEPSRVVKIERHSFVGHVYNLETTQGWYVAGGIVTHNCVRVAVPTFKEA